MSTTHELQADFRAEVIERSHEVPVLVDFWAEWCGPCRMLGPVLESLAERAQGRWVLVKVDTERFVDVARAMHIQGIPAVKLFHRGEVIGEFVGALGEAQVLSFLEQHLPGPMDDAWKSIQALVAAGDADAARTALEEFLAANPTHDAARLEHAKLLVDADPAAAREQLQAITGDAEAYLAAENLLHLVDLVEWARTDAAPAGGNGSDPQALPLYREAALAFAAGRTGEALEKWIEVVARDRELDDDGARRACLALFALLGEDDPLVRDSRRRFSMALAV